LSEADAIIYSTLVGVVALVAWLSWVRISGARQAEVASGDVSLEAVRRAVDRQLEGRELVYGVHQGRLSVKAQRMRIHDAEGGLLTEVVFHGVPLNGVLQSFTLDGREYRCVNEGLLSGRSLLCDVERNEVVLSCQHGTPRNSFFRARSDDELFQVQLGSVFKGYSTLKRNGQEAGRLFDAHLPDCRVRVLALEGPVLSRLEQCFLLLSLPGRA
jgi:hypothetical protein